MEAASFYGAKRNKRYSGQRDGVKDKFQVSEIVKKPARQNN